MNPFMLILLMAVCGLVVIMIMTGIADYRHDKRKERERKLEKERNNINKKL